MPEQVNGSVTRRAFGNCLLKVHKKEMNIGFPILNLNEMHALTSVYIRLLYVNVFLNV